MLMPAFVQKGTLVMAPEATAGRSVFGIFLAEFRGYASVRLSFLNILIFITKSFPYVQM
jgi:hypothetical protein